MQRIETATCDQCGRRVSPQDLQCGLAHTVDPRRFCADCRALHNPPPLPTRPVATTHFRPWSSSRRPA